MREQPRYLVKYVAIYTGNWRHWRLGSKRDNTLVRQAVRKATPNNEACTNTGDWSDQKSIREIQRSVSPMQNRNR